MAYQLKPVRCDNCKFYNHDNNYSGEGKCNKSGEYTRDHRICNLLPTNEDKRNAKIKKWK